MEAMSEEDQPTPARLWRERLYSTVAVSLLLLLAAGLGLILLFEVPFRLLCGWAVHAWVTLPPLLPRWNELLLPLGALGLALFLTDRFIRWALAAKGSERAWQGRHTVAATFLVLLGAAAAIAMSGIVHQMVWLGGERWWGNGRSQVTVAMSHTRQIIMWIHDFEEQNGRYPESLADLDLPVGLRAVPSREQGLQEPFVYLKPTESPSAGEELLVLVSPLLPDSDRVVVGYLSGTTTAIQADQLPALLTQPRSTDHD
jgi:hypothetical protein